VRERRIRERLELSQTIGILNPIPHGPEVMVWQIRARHRRPAGGGPLCLDAPRPSFEAVEVERDRGAHIHIRRGRGSSFGLD
jgi:hypothetical protein